MMFEDFFEANQTVIWTSERLKCFMTSEIVDMEMEYELGEAVIAECHEISKRDSFPIVLIKMTLRSDASQHDYLYFIPAVNSIGIWYGSLSYEVVTPQDIGRRFSMLLSHGDRVGGKIAMRNNQLCFQFKKNYRVEKNHA